MQQTVGENPRPGPSRTRSRAWSRRTLLLALIGALTGCARALVRHEAERQVPRRFPDAGQRSVGRQPAVLVVDLGPCMAVGGVPCALAHQRDADGDLTLSLVRCNTPGPKPPIIYG